MPTYLDYCLKKLAWIPAEINDQIANNLYASYQLWHLNSPVPPIVQKLLPSLPMEVIENSDPSFISEVFHRDYQLDDFLDLLMTMPTRYHLNRELSGNDNPVRALFNWTCDIIHERLIAMGKNQRPYRAMKLKVIASKRDHQSFVDLDDELLVYGDDPFLERSWQNDLWFAKIDDDWATLREWFGIEKISDVIEVQPEPNGHLNENTQNISTEIFRLLPYLLSVVYHQQNSNYKMILGRLTRLNIYCVESLEINQRFKRDEGKQKRISSAIFLSVRDESDEKGFTQRRFGDLFIVPNEPDVFLLIGEQIAQFVETEKIADIFTVLWHLKDHRERIAFLKTKGVNEEVFENVKKDLHASLKNKSFENETSQVFDFSSIFKSQEQEPIKQPDKFNHQDEILKNTDDEEEKESKPERKVPKDESHKPDDSTKIILRKGFLQSKKEKKTRQTSKPKGKLRSYVSPAETNLLDENLGNVDTLEIDRIGIKKVLIYEMKNGRKPKQMPHHQEGYDIESKDEKGKVRYIEVKSISKNWGSGNAPGLTKAQFNFAKKQGDSFFLYIVECAVDDDASIYCIQNPANRVDSFHFDDGWKNYSDRQ